MDRWIDICGLEKQVVGERGPIPLRSYKVDYKKTLLMMQLSNQWISH
jgi:hypothetical protein